MVHSLRHAASRGAHAGRLALVDGSRVAVIGGGPAGSFFSTFLLDFAQMVDLSVTVDVFEPRDYSRIGPAACNGCGGIISESLVQHLAVDGIPLPGDVVQRGIDSYVLHMERRKVRIATPGNEKRIGAVHRGAGPRDLEQPVWRSFDGHLLQLACARGARKISERVSGVQRLDGGFELRTRTGSAERYDLLVVATGVNSPALRMFEQLDLDYEAPRSVKTFIREYHLGAELIEAQLGNSMHVFLLDLPGLEFAALIPKGDYVTLCMLGEKIDRNLLDRFLATPEVVACLPEGHSIESFSCQCAPHMSVRAAAGIAADRLVFIGDSGVTRLYKDGIGAAYRTAKAAAQTAVFHGIGAEDFEEHYVALCRKIERDNAIGRLMFGVTGIIRQLTLARRAILRIVDREQGDAKCPARMSGVLWDMFTGSAPYADIFRRTLHPSFLFHLGLGLLCAWRPLPDGGATPRTSSSAVGEE